ncbi:predicted protein [Arabidopsis lyrata subsp. lyrata]|uniref:Predicted protein n=1 Tax=Arabidopsis lyrata subsp. lyrata TaxID=81972 RepID=D7MI90_ARALL|nr:predicted protein [Arabidopsis lyrata subsp. lyrata]
MVDNDGESKGSKDEYYKQVKQKQEAKRVAKAEIYSREVSGGRDGIHRIDPGNATRILKTRERITGISTYEKKVNSCKGHVRDIY